MPARSRAGGKKLGDPQYAQLAAFRYALRRFLRFSEDAAHDAGITSLQYQLMVHIAGMPDREWATVGELAELLQAKPHGVVALVTRCEEAGLVRRQAHKADGRLVEVHLTPKGRRIVERLAAQHLAQLDNLGAVIEAARATVPPQEED